MNREYDYIDFHALASVTNDKTNASGFFLSYITEASEGQSGINLTINQVGYPMVKVFYTGKNETFMAYPK